MSALEQIRNFLCHKRFAMVGVSQHPKDFSRVLFRELQSRGYDVVPVNPAAVEIDGQKCFANMMEVQPPVSAALLMTSPKVTERVVRECAEAHVGWVWMFRGGGAGAVSAEAVGFCESQGIAVIPGECPFMFLPDGGWIHGLHGWVKKIVGTYPN